MSLSKSESGYLNNCLHFVKCPVPFALAIFQIFTIFLSLKIFELKDFERSSIVVMIDVWARSPKGGQDTGVVGLALVS
jgi:hypothetical protein